MDASTTNPPEQQLTVIIPGLLPPASMVDNLLQGLQLPALTTLLQRADRSQRTDITDMETLLATLMHIPRQADWPLGAIMAQHDYLPAHDGYWFRADPVYLTPARDHLLLTDASMFHLSADDSQAFVAAFGQHFAQNEYSLHAPQPKHWYLRVPHSPDLRTHPLSLVCGQNVEPFLPTGEDAMAWHRFYNEIQMLFFSLPVNESRQQRGLPPVNSIWCWGGGTLPTSSPYPFHDVWGDDPLLAALAAHQHGTAHPLPQTTQHMTGLVVLHQLQQALQYADYHSWQDALRALDDGWFQFWLSQIRQNKIKQLTVWSFGDNAAYCWRISRSNLWRFWQRESLDSLLQRR